MYFFTIYDKHGHFAAQSDSEYWTKKSCERAGMAKLHALESVAPADGPYELEILESYDRDHWDHIHDLMDLGL